MFEKATRMKSKARIAFIGPSGAGKTLSALLLAYGITGSWEKIALIDTEHGRGKFYAERSDFNTGSFLYAPLDPPYTPNKYIELVNEAVRFIGSDGVVIIDSFSHAWDNEGGVLDIKSNIAKTSKNNNDFAAWQDATKIQNNLVNTILSVDCHTFVTMRTKMAYAMEQNERGKTVPVKVGLAPIQRENTEYEFDICFQIDRSHNACLSKDTTFLDSWTGVITPELGRQLGEWLSEGTEPTRCECCGKTITAKNGKTPRQIIEVSIKELKKTLCYDCFAKEYRARKVDGNAAATVSE